MSPPDPAVFVGFGLFLLFAVVTLVGLCRREPPRLDGWWHNTSCRGRMSEQARERVAALRAAGVNVSRLDLRDLGLTTLKGDVSDYLAGGGDPTRLCRPRRRVRRSA